MNMLKYVIIIYPQNSTKFHNIPQYSTKVRGESFGAHTKLSTKLKRSFGNYLI